MIRIMPSEIRGRIKPPASKSHAQRLIAASLLVSEKTIIKNLGQSDDVLSAIAIAKLCKQVSFLGDVYEANGKMSFANDTIFSCGESALCARMFTPILATSGKNFTVNAEKTLLKRPVVNELYYLANMGLKLGANGDFLPINILSGKLKAGNYSPKVSVSSQFASGLLMSLPTCNGDSILNIKNIVSRPYIDLSLAVMNSCGIELDERENGVFFIKGNQKYSGFEQEVESDWSSAVFWILAAALCGDITIEKLNFNSKQADMDFMQILKLAKIKFTINADELRVEKSVPQAFNFDFTNSPDLFPAAAVLASFANGTSIFSGISRLAHKESNRLQHIIDSFNLLGINTNLNGDILKIQGGEPKSHQTLNSHGDHRLAMAFSIMALASKHGLTIENTECVSKSYPGFYQDLRSLT
ncbi:MAG: 3-phosphoshikimate 1-carboxyvinyltransferase [Bacteroidales bacterium]|nr:3-phosphoshikimate 1-carboxyvinyltransferase [Bacteroidales bacterium]